MTLANTKFTVMLAAAAWLNGCMASEPAPTVTNVAQESPRRLSIVATPDTFTQAVGFALTGSDDTEKIRIIDRANCVVGSQRYESTSIYHLNNVQLDRLVIQYERPAPPRFPYVSVELHGSSTVV